MLRLWIYVWPALLAALCCWLGLSIPVHFRSVSPLVLASAGEGTPQLESMARTLLDRGQVGAAEWLALAAGPSATAAVAANAAPLLAQRPHYVWSGGAAPYFELIAGRLPEPPIAPTPVAALLVPPANRAALLGFLDQSDNRFVRELLATRHLTGYLVFLPVNSAAGQPLDAAILTLALLEQSDALPPALAADLRATVDAALAGDLSALRTFEATCAAVLSLARHANWRQLETWIGRCPQLDDLLFCAAHIQQDAERRVPLYAALMLSATPADVIGYLQRHGDAGWQGLLTALPFGQGGLAALARFDQPIYQRPAFWPWLPGAVYTSELALRRFAERIPVFAQLIKLLALTTAAWAMVLLVSRLFHIRLGGDPVRRQLLRVDRLATALVLGLLGWIAIEPSLMQFSPNEGGTMRLNLAGLVPSSAESTNQPTNDSPMDQVTLLVLLLFFFVQLAIFIFGLLRLRIITRMDQPPAMQLRLLDNEENLFDLGLYVGLGGTVGSLILVVMNIVDASLMAAYASTLFGILFVAILKVGFVRPARRTLILAHGA
jgi:hypothetical protein